MFSLTSLAAAAVAVVLGGTGTAAVVMNSPPAVDAGADITAKANADLRAAEAAQQRAIALLSDTTAEGKAEAKAQLELATTRLENASTSMKAAVETGSKAAVNGLGDFTNKSIRLVGSLATTASATANASVKAGSDIVRAVDTQISTARGVVAAQGDAVLAALTQTRAQLPASISASVDSTGTVTPAAPAASTSVSASGSVNGTTSTSGAAGLVGSATGSVSALLGGK